MINQYLNLGPKELFIGEDQKHVQKWRVEAMETRVTIQENLFLCSQVLSDIYRVKLKLRACNSC